MGLYRKKGSRFWWMCYSVDGVQRFDSTKTASKGVAQKIWKKREAEIALGLFKVGWRGERMTFDELCDEFERSHFAGLTTNTVKGHQTYIKQLKSFFGGRMLAEITAHLVEQYRDDRKKQPSKRRPAQSIKGATVNRELECLQCIMRLAVLRKHIPENPADGVKHFNEQRERPEKRMLTVEEEQKILESAPPYLRVGIVLLAQTGLRTYSEGFSLRWDQVDFENRVIRLRNDVKTPASTGPVPLSELAHRVLWQWKQELGKDSPFLFPSPVNPGSPISTVKTVWKSTLKKAGVPHFPIYELRHAFCTRLSWVAPDAVVQGAMRHSSPETKRRYQLGMTPQIKQAIDLANERVYGRQAV